MEILNNVFHPFWDGHRINLKVLHTQWQCHISKYYIIMDPPIQVLIGKCPTISPWNSSLSKLCPCRANHTAQWMFDRELHRPHSHGIPSLHIHPIHVHVLHCLSPNLRPYLVFHVSGDDIHRVVLKYSAKIEPHTVLERLEWFPPRWSHRDVWNTYQYSVLPDLQIGTWHHHLHIIKRPSWLLVKPLSGTQFTSLVLTSPRIEHFFKSIETVVLLNQ